MSEIRLNWQWAQGSSDGYPTVRVNFQFAQANTGGYPAVRANLFQAQPLLEGYPLVRVNFFQVQVLFPAAEDLPVSTNPFPGFGNSISNPALPAGADPFNTSLPGLTFSVKKRPMFKTNITEAASGAETRNALADYPRWDFELSYDFLEDRTGAESSLKTIMGFFLARQGAFDSWLFKDPDDYLVTLGVLGTGTGAITQFPFCRTMGEFQEKVGQVDTVNTINVYSEANEARTVPVTPGPYTLTANIVPVSGIVDKGVTYLGSALTKVGGAPGALEYSVNELTGVYTLNAARQGNAVVLRYRRLVDVADYTVTLPNLVVFDVAPAAGAVITASFQFYFACRFNEDQMDFEKFMDKLWSLQECNFRSIIQ